MRIDFNISASEIDKFDKRCEAVVRNVGRGTKMATKSAVVDIITEALAEVPIDTGTLANSIFGGVSGRGDTKGYTYMGIVGFGDASDFNRGLAGSAIEWIKEPNNSVNPKSGQPASMYATRVHEDLSMPHPHGGKAKFLEDPVRNYASDRFMRTAMTYWKEAIDGASVSSTGVQRGGTGSYKGESR